MCQLLGYARYSSLQSCLYLQDLLLVRQSLWLTVDMSIIDAAVQQGPISPDHDFVFLEKLPMALCVHRIVATPAPKT